MNNNEKIINAINKSVFFLGAGFSHGTGCLMSNQMYRRIREMIANDTDSHFLEIEKESLKFLLASLNYHSEWRSMEISGEMEFVPNIEELALLIRRIKNRENIVPYPITGNWSDKLVSLETQYNKKEKPNSYDNLFKALYDKLKGLLHTEWLNVNPEKLSYLDSLRDLASKFPQSKLRYDIFSLNNDLVLETYFKKFDETPFRGFSGGEWRSIFKQDVSNTENYNKINLYKLHGSIDWIRLEDGSVRETDRFKDEDEDFFNECCKESGNNSSIHYPYVIFGQGVKTFSVEPFFSLLNFFHQTINSKEKSYIFVIGYSFFDPYINNLLLDAAKDDTYLIIVNPYFGPKKNYQKCENGEDKPKPNKNKNYTCEFTKESSKSDLIDYLKLIQKNPFYSELPEFNNTSIRADNIEYIPLKVEEFLKLFFENEGAVLLNLITDLESKSAEDLPFL